MAYDLADGKELWRADGMGGEVTPGATFGGGCVFVAQSSGQAMALRATDGKPVWTNSELALPDIASPAYANGLLFMTSPDGTLTALDAKDGKIVWEHAMGKPARSSPLIAGGKVLLIGNDGMGRLIEAGRAFKILASCPLGEGVGASPALVDGRLYVRTEKRLFCLGEK
jgi:outer membrane protein assembly factor BamB